ncbi:hypothetical protein DMENIID0001_023890 [Sergentomyia squamirostris]
MSFKNKSALVTGATGGIGSAICESFLENGVKNLAVLDRNSEESSIVYQWKIKYPESTIQYFAVDVRSDKEMAECYDVFMKDIENLDIVVNSAAIFNEQAYREVVDVNVSGVIGSTLLAIEHMRKDREGKGKGGSIVNISSCAVFQPVKCMPTYVATKHAVLGFMQSLAKDHDYMGIKFLTICPGLTDTTFCLQETSQSIFFEEDNETTLKRLKSFYVQGPKTVADAVTEIIKTAKNGSVWTIQDDQLTEHNK